MLRLLVPALVFSAFTMGCTSTPKHVPPTKPAPKYTPPVKKTIDNTSTVSPNKGPIVNGSEMKDPPPPVVLPVTPGVAPATINTPTLPSTSAPVQPVSTSNVLPIMPPSPPEIGGTPTPPTSAAVIAPPKLD